MAWENENIFYLLMRMRISLSAIDQYGKIGDANFGNEPLLKSKNHAFHRVRVNLITVV